jgi:hypothetical protein
LNAHIIIDDKDIYSPNKTSAALIVHFAEIMKQNAPQNETMEAEAKYMFLYDVYIKARSYAITNKIFFVLSLIAGIAVLLWPSLNIIFKETVWLKSPIVQTTVTAIAALMFSFYSQYKEKQTYAETLMRYLVFSDEPVSSLSVKVTEELSKIDHGFSFNSIINKNDDKPPRSHQEDAANKGKDADTTSRSN